MRQTMTMTGVPVVVAALAAGLIATALPLDAQTERPTTRPFRTAWGAPDLQGIWTNATLTPVERPGTFGDRAVLSAEEAATFETTSAERRVASDRFIPGNVGAYNQFWMDGGTVVTDDRRTSLIVDPADGRIPWTRPGRERFTADSAKYGVGPFESWNDADTGERCLTDGLPFVPLQGYNMNYHILQAPGWIAMLNEMFHEFRLIPIDDRPHVPDHVGQWLGDARGRWDGETLVVETASFADKSRYLWRATWRAARPSLRLVERFTRVDVQTLDYEFTMTDPRMFTRPWTARVPMTTDHESRGVTSGPMYEYACHEGNYGLLNILRGARAEDEAHVTP